MSPQAPVKTHKIPDSTRTLLALYTRLDRLYAVMGAATEDLEQEIGKPVCVAKCGLCCTHTTPVVTELEAQYITAHIGTMPSDARRRVLDWLEEPIPGMKGGVIPQDVPLTQAQADVLMEDVHVLEGRPCPFLNRDTMGCSIYQVRPLVCRSYGVTMHQDSWCPRPLSWLESGGRRQTTRLGSESGRIIYDLITDIFDVAHAARRDDMVMLGFLPYLIASRIDPAAVAKLKANDRIARAKMGKGHKTAQGYALPQFKERSA